jgi:CheY-like chemotaxis protein/DNA-binding CsgD family transcriptional regulator
MARVLVVDDEPDIRELVRLNLERDGHDVLLAGDGMAALEVIPAEHPDLVVLDLMMPVMDGWEVLRRIKVDPDDRVSEMPVLLLTARTEDLDRVRGGIEGAIRYITKPFSVHDLRDAVTAALVGDPEPVKRRQAQHAALEQLARLEKGEGHDAAIGRPRPRLTRFETAPPPQSSQGPRPGGIDVSGLSAKQLELLTAVSRTKTVRDAADQLAVSRSNVYASLRRIARKLDVHSVPELVTLARSGSFDIR